MQLPSSGCEYVTAGRSSKSFIGQAVGGGLDVKVLIGGVEERVIGEFTPESGSCTRECIEFEAC
jgi:hypothetical protein